MNLHVLLDSFELYLFIATFHFRVFIPTFSCCRILCEKSETESFLTNRSAADVKTIKIEEDEKLVFKLVFRICVQRTGKLEQQV